jgi:hypothetical protein
MFVCKYFYADYARAAGAWRWPMCFDLIAMNRG